MTQPENTKDAKTATKAKKKKKPKGPIRWEAIAPFFIFVLLVAGYYYFFFDNHLRRLLVWGAESVNEAEVNVQSLTTSFRNLGFEVRNIQVTDPSNPSRNRLQIRRVGAHLVWDALLRGKIVVRLAEVQDIELDTERKRPGRLYPKTGRSSVEKVRDAALKSAAEKFSGNILGDVSSLLQGADPKDQLGKITGELKAEGHIKKTEQFLKEKEKEWQKRLAELPKPKEFEQLHQRLKSVKTSNFKNVQELQSSLQQIDKIVKEGKQKISHLEKTHKDFKTDLSQVESSVKKIEEYVQKDIRDLQKRLQIPSLDTKSIAMMLFGPMLHKYLAKSEKYMAKARQYMPPPKKKDGASQAKIQPRPRAQGKDYVFGRPNSYPPFWLKKGVLTTGRNEKGKPHMAGVFTDFSSAPSFLGQPAKVVIKGDLPQNQLYAIDGQILIDHRTEKARESFELTVGRYPVQRQALSEGPDAKFILADAKASASLRGELVDEEVQLTLVNQYRDVQYEVEAKQPDLKDILTGVSKDLAKIDVVAKAQGPWTALRFQFQSNLAQKLASSFQRHLQRKLDQYKAKIRQQVEQKIAAERAKVEREFAKFRSQVDQELAKINKKAKETEQMAQGEINKAKKNAENEAKKKVEDAGKKALEDLKKGLGF